MQVGFHAGNPLGKLQAVLEHVYLPLMQTFKPSADVHGDVSSTAAFTKSTNQLVSSQQMDKVSPLHEQPHDVVKRQLLLGTPLVKVL